jgi:hypothetical protein
MRQPAQFGDVGDHSVPLDSIEQRVPMKYCHVLLRPVAEWLIWSDHIPGGLLHLAYRRRSPIAATPASVVEKYHPRSVHQFQLEAS